MQACTGPLTSHANRQDLLAMNAATLAAIRHAALAMLGQKARCDIAGQPDPST